MLKLLSRCLSQDSLLNRRNVVAAAGPGLRAPGPRTPDVPKSLVRKYLEPIGWVRSQESGRCVDRCGRPLPWYTYPAIRAIGQCAKKRHQVFEYGYGNSSLWWRERSARVVSVEHDSEWCDRVGEAAEPHECKLIPAESEVNSAHCGKLAGFYETHVEPEMPPDHKRSWRTGLLKRPFHSYATEIMNYPAGFFDVIVVDGRARVLCAWLASQRIADDGFIVFDDTDRDIYSRGYEILKDAGFAKIDFWGPSPLNDYERCTSIFTRELSVFQ